MPSEEGCANCHRVIGALEEAFVWKDSIVCSECYERLSTHTQAAPQVPSQSATETEARRKWHYIVDGQQQGPLQEAELVNMLSEGRLPPETLVWTQEMKDWAPTNQIEGLLPKALVSQATSPSNAETRSVPGRTAFLHISVARLIVMSIVSCGLYEVYWIYKNWRYLKERDGLKIRPFWRAWFAIFYCHSLLKTIHQDAELSQVEKPSFSPGALATGWIVLIIVANLVGRQPGAIASIISFMFPSFLCFIPVQNYINSVNTKTNPNAPHSKWSAGHTVCLIWGILIWALTLLTMGVEY